MRDDFDKRNEKKKPVPLCFLLHSLSYKTIYMHRWRI